MFDDAPRETKQMILAELIERVDVAKEYEIRIKMRLTAKRFSEVEKKAPAF